MESHGSRRHCHLKGGVTFHVGQPGLYLSIYLKINKSGIWNMMIRSFRRAYFFKSTLNTHTFGRIKCYLRLTNPSAMLIVTGQSSRTCAESPTCRLELKANFLGREKEKKILARSRQATSTHNSQWHSLSPRRQDPILQGWQKGH